jgi:hypothetical protein
MLGHSGGAEQFVASQELRVISSMQFMSGMVQIISKSILLDSETPNNFSAHSVLADTNILYLFYTGMKRRFSLDRSYTDLGYLKTRYSKPSTFTRVTLLSTHANVEFADVETTVQWKNKVRFMARQNIGSENVNI